MICSTIKNTRFEFKIKQCVFFSRIKTELNLTPLEEEYFQMSSKSIFRFGDKNLLTDKHTDITTALRPNFIPHKRHGH